MEQEQVEYTGGIALTCCPICLQVRWLLLHLAGAVTESNVMRPSQEQAPTQAPTQATALRSLIMHRLTKS